MNNRKMTQWQYALTLLPYDEGMTEEQLVTMPKGALYRWIKKTKQIKQEARKEENEELAREYEELCNAHKNDLRKIAEQMTKLSKKSAHEWEGACPLCKDSNGFFVCERDREHWWNCRDCQKGGDVANLLMLKNNISFWEAVEELAGYSPREKAKVTRQRTYTIVTPEETHKEIADFSRKFDACLQTFLLNSLTGLSYFEHKRGLAAETAQKNRVGMIQTRRGLAIAYPCERLTADGTWQITAINRRFLDEVPAKERKQKPKTMLIKGGNWGLYRLHRIRAAKALFVVEGEENALSVWQAVRAQGWACDVASVGCQDNFKSLRADITVLAGEYQHLLVWADEQSIADKAIDCYRHKSSVAIYSPQLADVDSALDANDLLKTGQLAEFLSCYLSHLSKCLVRKQQAEIKATSKVTPVRPSDNTAREIEEDEQVRHNGQAPAHPPFWAPEGAQKGGPSAIAPELANDPDFELWAKYAREIEEDEQDWYNEQTPTNAPSFPAPPPDFDFDDGLLEAVIIADELATEQAKNLYLHYEEALMDQDILAATRVLNELRALRETVDEWRKFSEDRERLRRFEQGHY